MNSQTNKVTSFMASDGVGNLSQSAEVEKVFGIDLIFEKILKLLIFDKNLKFNRTMGKTVRLVDKHWLKTTSALLQKSTTPLFVIKTNEDCCSKNEKALNRIHKKLTSRDRLPYSILPFKLIITDDYFLQENHFSLTRCLTRLGNELIELKVSFPAYGGTMSMAFPKFNLPLLRKISYEILCRGTRCENNNGFLFLQQILNATRNLQDFVFLRTFYEEFPGNFELLKIPDSVSSVEFQHPVEDKQLEIFFGNKLPNLKHLSLTMPENSSAKEAVFKILKRFQRSLISIKLDGDKQIKDSILKFPKLENLEKIQVIGEKYEFEYPTDLKVLLPRIKSIQLVHITESTLTNWTGNSKLTSVESLSICNQVSDLNDPDFIKSYQIMFQVHTAFPNITTLGITVAIKDMSCLMYLFENMTQLESLRIDVRGDILTQCKWKYTSVLLGLPAWLISSHSQQSEYFQSFIDKHGRKPCLKNLSELTSFTLCIDAYPHKPAYEMEKKWPTDSNLLFTQVFFEMSKLQTILLSQNIQPSEQMEQKWRANGHFIEYITRDD